MRKKRGQPLGRYNAQGEHVDHDGRRIWVPSAAQAERSWQLVAMQAAGLIGRLEIEAEVPLIVNNIKVCDFRVPAIYEKLDPRGAPLAKVYEAVKGSVTAEWKIKARLFDAVTPEGLTTIELPKGDHPGVREWMAETWSGRLPD